MPFSSSSCWSLVYESADGSYGKRQELAAGMVSRPQWLPEQANHPSPRGYCICTCPAFLFFLDTIFSSPRTRIAQPFHLTCARNARCPLHNDAWHYLALFTVSFRDFTSLDRFRTGYCFRETTFAPGSSPTFSSRLTPFYEILVN